MIECRIDNDIVTCKKSGPYRWHYLAPCHEVDGHMWYRIDNDAKDVILSLGLRQVATDHVRAILLFTEWYWVPIHRIVKSICRLGWHILEALWWCGFIQMREGERFSWRRCFFVLPGGVIKHQ